jgi:hypothetical protein
MRWCGRSSLWAPRLMCASIMWVLALPLSSLTSAVTFCNLEANTSKVTLVRFTIILFYFHQNKFLSVRRTLRNLVHNIPHNAPLFTFPSVRRTLGNLVHNITSRYSQVLAVFRFLRDKDVFEAVCVLPTALSVLLHCYNYFNCDHYNFYY